MAKHRTNKDSSGRNGRGMDLVWGWYGVVWGGMGWYGEYVLVWGWYGDGMGYGVWAKNLKKKSDLKILETGSLAVN